MPDLDYDDAAIQPYSQNLFVRVLKIPISISFYAFREARRFVSRLLGRRTPGVAVAICYHQVFAEDRARFARQMDHLLRWTVPLRADHSELLLDGERCAIVTADDGWVSFVQNALPELRCRNIPVAIFVITGRMGDTMGEAADRIMSEQQLLELQPDIARGLLIIGSHTSTHARVTTLDESEALRELTGSRARLEQLLDREVDLFCFPFGSSSAETIELCRAACYRRTFLSIPSPALSDPHEFVTGRVRVDPSDWLVEFHLKLMGAYEWVPGAIMLKRRLLEALHMRGTSRDSVAKVRESNSVVPKIASES